MVPSLAIHDTMRHIKSDVSTVAFGGCMGMSGFLLAVGKKVREQGLYTTPLGSALAAVGVEPARGSWRRVSEQPLADATRHTSQVVPARARPLAPRGLATTTH